MKTRPASLLVILLVLCGLAYGQNTVTLHGRVVDRDGLGVGSATVTIRKGAATQTVSADAGGVFTASLDSLSSVVVVGAVSAGMSSGIHRVSVTNARSEILLVLQPSARAQQVNVVATRSGVEMGPSARDVTVLGTEELEQYAALTLDDRLRQHAGFELFRRSSGWVQNPTSQGISLRGLGSTAASRTLVLADGAPLNDPFGGWIHWNELPPESIDAVTIASGGGSDLYGSSALGGVIDVLPGRPDRDLGELSVLGAGEGTFSSSGRADLHQSRWGELFAAQYFRTDGYTLPAPGLRGTVDVPANARFETAHIDLDRGIGKTGRAFLTGNVLNEARSNGTPDQTNATRLWRYLAGDDWTIGSRLTGRARLFGSDEAYRQSFSAIPMGRASETLTRQQHVGTQELGGSADATLQFTHLAFVAGADVRDLRATDLETPIAKGLPAGVQDVTARQRFIGGFGEALGERGRWSGTISLRADSARNLSTSVITRSGASPASTTPVSDRGEIVLSPRIGIVRSLGSQVNLHASAFRAFRSPTMNELYRTGQVGQEVTLPNSTLISERATGAEGGVAWSSTSSRVRLDGTYFWTEINRPVAAVLLSATPTKITEMRENLGQIQSQGVELSARFNAGRPISGTFGYQYAHAVVTSFSAQRSLVGKWIPEVPRESATAQIRAASHRFGEATLALRESGRAFDDSANAFLLHGFFTMDLYGQHSFARHWTVFVAAQNLLDRRVEIARTPILTLGTPLTVQGGVRLRWGAAEPK